MQDQDRKLTRQIIRQVHPDLFASSPYEKQCNSESLKRLNNYVDEMSHGRVPKSTTLEFFVRDGPAHRSVQAQLTPSGSLSPLFFAFGLISADELERGGGVSSASDTHFLSWLKDQVQEAVRTAEQHDMMKWRIRKLRAAFEEKYDLAAVQIGAEYAVSLEEQEKQAEAMKILEDVVEAIVAEEKDPKHFSSLSIQLYHPSACPQESYSYVDDQGLFNMRSKHMKAFVGDDGALHLVADKATLRDQIKSLDLARARMLTQVSLFWLKRVRDLTPAITKLLGVRHVWCDTKSEQNSQKFVLWAGYLLEKRDEVEALFKGRQFSFSIIVHTDPKGPLLNFHQSSPILNVRADCPTEHLIEFLSSEGGSEASKASAEVQSTRAREEALLERVRQVFDAKCVIKICMNDKVKEAAMRLLDNAETIKQAVDLRGACIALDDCYEVWDSGFISIPYNFKIEELSNMVQRLQSGQQSGQPAGQQQAASGTAAPASSSGSAKAPSSSAAAAGSNAASAQGGASTNGSSSATTAATNGSGGSTAATNGSNGVGGNGAQPSPGASRASASEGSSNGVDSNGSSPDSSSNGSDSSSSSSTTTIKGSSTDSSSTDSSNGVDSSSSSSDSTGSSDTGSSKSSSKGTSKGSGKATRAPPPPRKWTTVAASDSYAQHVHTQHLRRPAHPPAPLGCSVRGLRGFAPQHRLVARSACAAAGRAVLRCI